MGTGLIDTYRNKVKKEWKIAFFATLAIGLLIHIYKFTNTLPNHDTPWNYYTDQDVTKSGRWFLSLACGFSSYFDLPWVNGILSLVFIAVAVIFIVEVFEIKNPILIVLTGGLVVSFPAVTQTFFYEYTADGYMLAMAMAAASVYLTTIDRISLKNAVISLLLIGCTCGVYQSYVSFALVLAICYMLLMIVDGRYKSSKIYGWVGKQAAIYASGLAFYYVAWKVNLRVRDVAVTSYQGIDSLSLSAENIKPGVKSAINEVGRFFVEWKPLEQSFKDIDWSLYSVLHMMLLIFLASVFIYVIIKNKVYRKAGALLLVVVGCVSIPFVCVVWKFLSPTVYYRTMMLVSYVVLFIFTGVLFEKYAVVKWKNICALLLSVIIFNYGLIANISYYFMNRVYETTYASAVEMLSEIHDLDTDSKEVLVVGANKKPLTVKNAPPIKHIHSISESMEENICFDGDHVVMFLNETFYETFTKSGWDWKSDAKASKEIRKMGCWPAEDSIQVINDVIVIKLK